MPAKKVFILRRRKKQFRRRKPYSKGLIRSFRRKPSNLVHSFKRNFVLTPIATGTNGEALQGYAFRLSSLPNFTDFSSLYDYYRLNYVVMRIMYRGSNLSSMESANNQHLGMPYMYYVIDRDDASAPSSVNEVREYSAARLHMFTAERRCCYIKLRPSILTETYKSAITTSYQVTRRRWLDLADDGNTPHYGVKMAIIVPVDSVQNYAAQDFDVEVRYYFQMKNPR